MIREGSPIYSTNFLLDIPESIWHSIRSVELKFTLKDLGLSSDVSAGDGGSTDVTSGESAGPTNGNSTQLTDEDGANNHRNDVSSSNEDNTTLETDLTTIWWDKFYAISSLNLTHLLLQVGASGFHRPPASVSSSSVGRLLCFILEASVPLFFV